MIIFIFIFFAGLQVSQYLLPNTASLLNNKKILCILSDLIFFEVYKINETMLKVM